jgi:hypothetical protein
MDHDSTILDDLEPGKYVMYSTAEPFKKQIDIALNYELQLHCFNMSCTALQNLKKTNWLMCNR